MARKGRKADCEKLKDYAKRYRLLNVSWAVQAKLFFENSTLHGVRYVAEQGRPFIEKFLWFVCVAIGTIATTIIIVSLWEKFQTNPTITGLDTDFHSWDVPFPAITLCPFSPSNDSDIESFINEQWPNSTKGEDLRVFFKALTQISYQNLDSFAKLLERGSVHEYMPENMDPKELAFKLMIKCEDMIINCEWKSAPYNCCEGFMPVFTENGFCYTFNSRHYEKSIPWSKEPLPEFEMKYIKETDIKWALKFEVNVTDDSDKIAIYIHNSDEIPGKDAKPQHIWDYKVEKISFSVKQTYTTEDARQLSIKQRHCIFENERKLIIDRIYTYSACTRQCRLLKTLAKCHCIPLFYPLIHGERICSFKEYQCINLYMNEISSEKKCDCELGCSNTVYEIEKLNENSGVEREETDGKLLETTFVSWPMVRYKREVLFGWVDLLVSFGGIAGLFLGFSLLSGVEIIYYFTVRACCMVHKEHSELEKIELQNKSKNKMLYLNKKEILPAIQKKNKHIKKVMPAKMNIEKRAFTAENVEDEFFKKLAPVNVRARLKPPAEVIKSPFGIEFLH